MSTTVLESPKQETKAPTTRPLPDPAWVTAEQVEEMDGDYPRVEIWYGQLKVKMPARPRRAHGKMQARISRFLDAHADENNLGDVYCESGTLLRRAPDVLFGPDVAFYSSGREHDHPTYYTGGPDLVVEILSPNNTRAQVEEKIDLYLRHGSRQVWVADLIATTVTVHTLTDEPKILGVNDTIDGGEVLPGLQLPVARLF
jgi:Uma2 family endonuclease